MTYLKSRSGYKETTVVIRVVRDNILGGRLRSIQLGKAGRKCDFVNFRSLLEVAENVKMCEK